MLMVMKKWLSLLLLSLIINGSYGLPAPKRLGELLRNGTERDCRAITQLPVSESNVIAEKLSHASKRSNDDDDNKVDEMLSLQFHFHLNLLLRKRRSIDFYGTKHAVICSASISQISNCFD